MIGGLAVILPVGRLYSIYNPKWVYIVSFVIFLAASALCGAAPSIEAEIVGRVIAGAGGNGIYYGLLALLSMHTTTRERPQYLSYTYVVCCFVFSDPIPTFSSTTLLPPVPARLNLQSTLVSLT